VLDRPLLHLPTADQPRLSTAAPTTQTRVTPPARALLIATIAFVFPEVFEITSTQATRGSRASTPAGDSCAAKAIIDSPPRHSASLPTRLSWAAACTASPRTSALGPSQRPWPSRGRRAGPTLRALLRPVLQGHASGVVGLAGSAPPSQSASSSASEIICESEAVSDVRPTAAAVGTELFVAVVDPSGTQTGPDNTAPSLRLSRRSAGQVTGQPSPASPTPPSSRTKRPNQQHRSRHHPQHDLPADTRLSNRRSTRTHDHTLSPMPTATSAVTCAHTFPPRRHALNHLHQSARLPDLLSSSHQPCGGRVVEHSGALKLPWRRGGAGLSYSNRCCSSCCSSCCS
jgi:hypothetical protein